MEEYLINKAPPTLYYIPNFINADEEEHILAKVNNAPKPKWTYLSHRRLQNWGGNPMPKGMIPEPLPDWLKFYVDQINNFDVFPNSSKANHVLVNEYLSGQGIMIKYEQLENKLDMRRKQFHVLFASLHQLQALLDEDVSDENNLIDVSLETLDELDNKREITDEVMDFVST